jgi:tetratricopeptide (TPR) repeat protein
MLERLPEPVPPALAGRAGACIHLARSLRALAQGNLSCAAYYANLSLEAFRQAGAVRDVGTLLEVTGYVHGELGLHEQAKAFYEEHLSLAQRLGFRRSIPDAKRNLGMVRLRTQRWAEAQRLLDEAATAYAALGMEPFEALSLGFLALGLAGGGDLEAARSAAERSLGSAAAEPSTQALALAAAAKIDLLRGEPARALAAAERAMQLVRQHQLFEQVSLIRSVHAEALLAQGRLDEARRALAEAESWVEEQASKIQDVALRHSFLTCVPENARIHELAASLAPAAQG